MISSSSSSSSSISSSSSVSSVNFDPQKSHKKLQKLGNRYFAQLMHQVAIDPEFDLQEHMTSFCEKIFQAKPKVIYPIYLKDIPTAVFKSVLLPFCDRFDFMKLARTCHSFYKAAQDSQCRVDYLRRYHNGLLDFFPNLLQGKEGISRFMAGFSVYKNKIQEGSLKTTSRHVVFSERVGKGLVLLVKNETEIMAYHYPKRSGKQKAGATHHPLPLPSQDGLVKYKVLNSKLIRVEFAHPKLQVEVWDFIKDWQVHRFSIDLIFNHPVNVSYTRLQEIDNCSDSEMVVDLFYSDRHFQYIVDVEKEEYREGEPYANPREKMRYFFYNSKRRRKIEVGLGQLTKTKIVSTKDVDKITYSAQEWRLRRTTLSPNQSLLGVLFGGKTGDYVDLWNVENHSFRKRKVGVSIDLKFVSNSLLAIATFSKQLYLLNAHLELLHVVDTLVPSMLFHDLNYSLHLSDWAGDEHACFTGVRRAVDSVALVLKERKRRRERLSG